VTDSAISGANHEKIILGFQGKCSLAVPKMRIRPPNKSPAFLFGVVLAAVVWRLPPRRCSVYNMDLVQALLGSEASVNGTTAYTGIRHCGLVSPSHPRLYHPRHGLDPRQTVFPGSGTGGMHHAPCTETSSLRFLTGAGSSAIRITTDIFSTWRAAGITCEHELFVTSIALLSLSALFLHCCTECDLV